MFDRNFEGKHLSFQIVKTERMLPCNICYYIDLDLSGPFVIPDDSPGPSFPQMETPGQDTFSSYLASGRKIKF